MYEPHWKKFLIHHDTTIHPYMVENIIPVSAVTDIQWSGILQLFKKYRQLDENMLRKISQFIFYYNVNGYLFDGILKYCHYHNVCLSCGDFMFQHKSDDYLGMIPIYEKIILNEYSASVLVDKQMFSTKLGTELLNYVSQIDVFTQLEKSNIKTLLTLIFKLDSNNFALILTIMQKKIPQLKKWLLNVGINISYC